MALIDRGNVMLDYLQRLGTKDTYKAKHEALEAAVDNAPTIDAVPVVHASWMIHYYDMDTYSFKCVPYNESSFNNPEGIMFCSHCDKEALCNGIEEYTPSRYCPFCVARMDGEDV